MNHTTSVRDNSPKQASVLERAAQFHGHLGPFLTIGVRMGIIGLKRLGNPRANSLMITASLPLQVPFSCIIDGLQVSTNCTIGNQLLSLKDSSTIQVKLERKDNGQAITIALNESVLKKLRAQLPKTGVPNGQVRELAWMIAKIPEEELFNVTLYGTT